MYGFIIEGIRQAVLVTHGLDVWKRLCARLSAMSGGGGGGKSLAADESFQATSIYGEGMPIEIARAAAEVLGCSLNSLLEACGEFYITVCVCLASVCGTKCNQWCSMTMTIRVTLRFTRQHCTRASFTACSASCPIAATTPC